MAAALALSKCYSFYIKVFYVMSKALTGQLSFWQTGLVSFLFVDSSTLLHSEQPKLFGVLAVLSAIGFTFIRKMFLRGVGTLSADATPRISSFSSFTSLINRGEN